MKNGIDGAGSLLYRIRNVYKILAEYTHGKRLPLLLTHMLGF